MRIHRHRQYKPKLSIPTFRINERITVPEVRVIYNDTAQVLPIQEALELAQEQGLDLIEVSPKANPPVCKLMEFSNFKYQKEKEAKKQRAASKEVELKGIRLSFRIGQNDLQIRVNQAKKFLEKGNKLKLEMQLRGREKEHKERAKEIFESFVEMLRSDFSVRVESPVQYQSGRMNMIVARDK